MTSPNPGGKSLLSRYLTPEVWDKLKDKETRYGVRLVDVIASGLAHPESSVGVYAGDAESYTLFAPLLDPIIAEYHGFGPDEQHKSDLDPAHLRAQNPDPEGKYVLSTRIRVARNLCCFPLGPALTRRERRIVETVVTNALTGLGGELAGRYYPLYEMDEATKSRLIQDHFLFKEGDRFLEAAGLNRDWPDARGIFHNSAKTFLVWVNEEDQLRIISMQPGADLQQVFERLALALGEMEKRLSFEFSERLGYITSCPTNLGTAMRASVHIRLPNLGREQIETIAGKYGLQVRGTHGEHSESEGGVYDVSNKRRLGITEVEAVRQLAAGTAALIAAAEGAG
jgi:protein-arginine kinase